MRPGLHVHPVKGDHDGLGPALDERQQVHAGVSEVDVHQVRGASLQQVARAPRIRRDRRWAARAGCISARSGGRSCCERQGPIRPPPPGMGYMSGHCLSLQITKVSVAPQAGDLPVDVPHLRLQERRAVACDRRHDSLHVVCDHLGEMGDELLHAVALVRGDRKNLDPLEPCP